MNNPDTPDDPDTDPFQFDFVFGANTLSVEAHVSDGTVLILECKIGETDFDIERLAQRRPGRFDFISLESLIEDAAWEYLEDSR